MLLSTLVLSQLDYVNSIFTMALITMIKPYSKNAELCSQSGLQEVIKRRHLHMPKRITLAAHKLQNCIQTAHNFI